MASKSKVRKASHTPGPWSVHPATIGGNQIVRGPDGERVCLCDTASPYRKPQGRSHEPQDRVANARLISAAPDLLAACKAALDRWQQLYPLHHCGLRMELQAAITKAEEV